MGAIPLTDRIRAAELALQAEPDHFRDAIGSLVEALGVGAPGTGDEVAALEGAIALCRTLYGRGRSADALPVARAALACARRGAPSPTLRRAAMACGLLSVDTGDLVGALEYHVQSLRIATAEHDAAMVAGIWNNIGHAFGVLGNHGLAVTCYKRAVALLESEHDPSFSRYAAWVNLADSHFQLGNAAEGLGYAERALHEMTPAFAEQDPYSAILLRRNFVRLLVALGRPADADHHARAASALAERVGTARARIAADITRASLDLANGHPDLALTRMHNSLGRAREVPAILRDTLVALIRAEEAAGNVERALLRLEELSDHLYGQAVDRVKRHVEIASVTGAFSMGLDPRREQERARLISKLAPPAPPESWKALQRLAVSAAMRQDESGMHGVRVGTLSKMLALQSGVPPLQAMEIGFAAELHDIGMLSVPEALLAKPGPLNAAEQAIVRRHVDAGADMLGDDRHPRVFLARQVAKYHHARWDGEGYPERVGGRFIPLAARICSVADAYDMMLCGYGGRPRRGMAEALEELRREAGRQFDPELVSCFEAMIRAEWADSDLAEDAGFDDFQALVRSLKEDRGFV